MINPIDKILTEWAYRVHNGMPNPNNPYHLIQLNEAMSSLKLPRRFKHGGSVTGAAKRGFGRALMKGKK